MINRLRIQTAAFQRAALLVRIYYVALLWFPLATLGQWPALIERPVLAPLWPASWLRLVDPQTGSAAILVLHLLTTLLGAIFPTRRWARVLAFVGLLEFAALNNSFGKIGHSQHLWVLTSFVLIFLPNLCGKISRLGRQRFLLTFWCAQAIVLLTYSMAGLGKLCGAIYQVALGQANLFQPEALALIVADRLRQTGSQSVLGPWLTEHPLAGWPMLMADLLLQLLAFPIAFRPTLHRSWAIGLMLFHLGAYLLLTINFAPSALLLAILLFNSPFARRRCAS